MILRIVLILWVVNFIGCVFEGIGIWIFEVIVIVVCFNINLLFC